jgi:GrpB-like predicted nucleotidyltransferase (UPF0157 family)
MTPFMQILRAHISRARTAVENAEAMPTSDMLLVVRTAELRVLTQLADDIGKAMAEQGEPEFPEFGGKK